MSNKFKHVITQSKKLSSTTKLIYGGGELLNATSTVIILMLYLKFLIDTVGLSPMMAGVCLVSGKLWDAFSDPLIGAISDRTHSRFGRRRIYFLLFSVPASVAFAAMWIKMDTAALWTQVVYYAAIYVAFKTLATALNVPYQALGPELTDDYDDRTSLITFRMAFAISGAIAAGVVPNIIVERFAQSDQPEAGYLLVAAIFGAFYVVSWILIFLKVEERSTPRSRPKLSFFRALGLTMQSRSFRMLIGMYLCAFLALDVLTAAAKFYVDEFLANPKLMPLVMGSMLGSALLALPLYLRITARFERKRALFMGLLVWLCGLALLSTLERTDSTAWLVASMFLVGLGVSGAFIVPWSALPEVIDVDKIVNGRAQEGIFSGVMTFLRKVSTTGALFLLSATLDLTGYLTPEIRGTTAQPENTLRAIQLLITAVPALLLVIGILFTLRYPIDKRGHALIRKRLEQPTEDALSQSEREELKKLIQRVY
ncbi:MAG: MFS transporter [Proteobacteria bacterium]|nr:MFS transporter [Pseudomonadota bacterium]